MFLLRLSIPGFCPTTAKPEVIHRCGSDCDSSTSANPQLAKIIFEEIGAQAALRNTPSPSIGLRDNYRGQPLLRVARDSSRMVARIEMPIAATFRGNLL